MPEGLMAADQARSSVKATELFPPFPEVTSGNGGGGGGRGDHLAGLFDSDSNSDPDEELSTAPSSPIGTGGGGTGGGSGSPVTSPPYWLQTHGHHGGRRGVGQHGRTISNISTESVLPITLQDNEEEEDDSNEQQRLGSSGSGGAYGRDRNKACWAKSVEIRDYVIVNGSATNIGAFVVWNIRVETLTGSYMNIRKRYSEFDELRRQLIFTFPNFEAAVPALPRKSLFSKFSPVFLEKRRSGLQYFLNCILLNPEFSGSPILKDFLFS